MRELIRQRRHRLALLAGRLDSCSPAKKLGSGYAYVQNERERTLRSVADAQEREHIYVHLLDGRITARIEQIEAGKI